MPVLTRITVDLVTEEGLTEGRRNAIARELTDSLHTITVEPEDGAFKNIEKYVEAHEHDGVDNRCGFCVEHSLDDRNGETALED